MSGPRVSTGPDSKQDYSTPPEFISAVERRFGAITFDLAANAANAKASRWFGPGGLAENALIESWAEHVAGGLAWLNPPFADIAPWARKSADTTIDHRGARQIMMLVPAAVGSNWFRDHVAPFADVYLLNGRLCFDGKNLFPKDCLLAHYHGGAPCIRIWNWRTDVVHQQWVKSLDSPNDRAIAAGASTPGGRRA